MLLSIVIQFALSSLPAFLFGQRTRERCLDAVGNIISELALAVGSCRNLHFDAPTRRRDRALQVRRVGGWREMNGGPHWPSAANAGQILDEIAGGCRAMDVAVRIAADLKKLLAAGGRAMPNRFAPTIPVQFERLPRATRFDQKR